ncbi:hypothetical protein Scep_004790 [Stephania cephalantha]|uniref:Uncharacterized protein n=1 Tax=Stephania cephalantha TaxID=152367 RepID=A0AAP0PZG3_9MAGN
MCLVKGMWLQDHTLNQRGEDETAICLWSLQTFACLLYCSDAVSSYAWERSFSCFRLKKMLSILLHSRYKLPTLPLASDASSISLEMLWVCMARSKTPVTREKVGVEVSRGNRGRGGRRPPTASYQKEKEKVDVKGNEKTVGNRAKNVQLHDEGSNIDTRRQKDLLVARGEDEAHTSESSRSDSSAPADTTSTDRNVGESTSGGGGNNEGESQEQLEMCDPFPGDPSDGSLLKSFKDHVALTIWSNEDRPILKCINHGARIQEWDLQSCHPDTEGL